MKLYTVKNEEDLLEKLGIFDITNPSDAFGQEFNIGSALDITFPLDDRSSGRLWYKHVLRIFFSGRDTWINFGRPGHEDQLSTTVRNLFRLRARQALDEGSPITINGRRFIVLGQGGSKGSLLFFPDDLESRMDTEDQFQMAPTLAAEVSVRRPDGRNQRIADRVPLGWVGNRYYYLNFDYASESWIPSE